MKKLICSLLVISMVSLSSGVYANSINIKLPDNGYSNAAQYIEFGENTTVYDYPVIEANENLEIEVVSDTQTMLKQQLNSNNVMRLGVVKIAKGTSLDVYMQESINTAIAEVGKNVSAMIKEDLVVNNSIVIPQGSFIKGKITKANHAGMAGKNGKVSIVFDTLVLPEGEVYKITAEQIDFEVNQDGTFASTAAKAAGTVLLGAAIGSVFTGNGYSSKTSKDYTNGAIGGAIVAGVAVVGYLVTRRGKDATIPEYTEISITLDESIDIPITGKY